MAKFKYTEDEKKLNTILAYQDKRLTELKESRGNVDSVINESELLLKDLGYEINNLPKKTRDSSERRKLRVPSLEQLYEEALEAVGSEANIEDLFSVEELLENEEYIYQLNREYNQIHKLDKMDYAIAVGAGMLGAIVDILLVGLPENPAKRVEAKPLSTWVRDYFDKKYSPELVKELEKNSKVPYDAPYNHYRDNFLNEHVEGLTPYFHRLLSLGHDPLIGWIIGTLDIINCNMTTIDKVGKVVPQSMQGFLGYEERQVTNIVEALALQFNHFKSDVNTTMGLPAPLMGLFDLFQLGEIGDEKQTIAEIVQSMYYEGYDFRHFCSMSVPMMITEIITRVGYTIKAIKEGKEIKEAVATTVNREKHPKIGTMLFLAHSVEAAANAGKVYFTQNPTAINYPQWAAFAKYSYQQIKWLLVNKPEHRAKYVDGKLMDELDDLMTEVDKSYDWLDKRYEVIVI